MPEVGSSDRSELAVSVEAADRHGAEMLVQNRGVAVGFAVEPPPASATGAHESGEGLSLLGDESLAVFCQGCLRDRRVAQLELQGLAGTRRRGEDELALPQIRADDVADHEVARVEILDLLAHRESGEDVSLGGEAKGLVERGEGLREDGVGRLPRDGVNRVRTAPRHHERLADGSATLGSEGRYPDASAQPDGDEVLPGHSGFGEEEKILLLRSSRNESADGGDTGEKRIELAQGPLDAASKRVGQNEEPSRIGVEESALLQFPAAFQRFHRRARQREEKQREAARVLPFPAHAEKPFGRTAEDVQGLPVEAEVLDQIREMGSVVGARESEDEVGTCPEALAAARRRAAHRVVVPRRGEETGDGAVGGGGTHRKRQAGFRLGLDVPSRSTKRRKCGKNLT